MNTLSGAASSYLRSAMHQPIAWNEWGPEAMARAQRENKPILLDIGAVWCHWCHVMDRESYDNPEIAQIINDNYVAIKVDRDERPDVDSRYQAAVQAISGQGGWPLTAFLTPEGKPFFGGTYFPPDDLHGRPGFKRVLRSIAQAFRDKHTDVMESAESVMAAISSAESFRGRSGSLSRRILDRMVDSALKMFDARNGGFGSQPKFQHASAMDLLIDQYARGSHPQLEPAITTTLEKMARGGVYDQLAGGFHRYSVDDRWVVPHFEKMSYDNSELLKNYVHGYQATETEFFAAVARDIIRWMDEWLSDREHGGFYASQDADLSMDDDGDYFTWSLEEARAVLDGMELEAAALHYDIGEVGEMHHDPTRNVLFVREDVAQLSKRMLRSPAEMEALLDSAKKKMYEARKKRATPYVDKTIYVNWNSLCISAYLEAARVLGLDGARKFALQSLDRALSVAWDPERGLAHVIAYSDPQATPRRIPGLLDDYAATAIACLDAYEATAALSYFTFAGKIADMMLEKFYDPTGGGFFDASVVHAEAGIVLGALSARRKPLQDSPTPSGNGLAATALLRMFAYTNNAEYQERAQQTLETFAGIVEQYGIFAGAYGTALQRYLEPHIQIVIVGPGADSGGAGRNTADALERAALAPFRINKAVVRLTDSAVAAQNLPPALAETIPQLPAVQSGETVAVVCSGFACQPPVSDAEQLAAILMKETNHGKGK